MLLGKAGDDGHGKGSTDELSLGHRLSLDTVSGR